VFGIYFTLKGLCFTSIHPNPNFTIFTEEFNNRKQTDMNKRNTSPKTKLPTTGVWQKAGRISNAEQ
jgi:hypothetical protein